MPVRLTCSLILIDGVTLSFAAVLRVVHKLHPACAWDDKVRGLILVPVSMPAAYDPDVAQTVSSEPGIGLRTGLPTPSSNEHSSARCLKVHALLLAPSLDDMG